MLVRYYEGMPMKFHTEVMEKIIKQYGGDIEKLSQDLFANSIFTSSKGCWIFWSQIKRMG